MTRIETEAKIEELEEQLLDAQDELKARPTNTIEVEVIREVTIENSGQSETLGELGLALSKAQYKFESVDKSTEAYNYKYATIADTIKMVRPILSEYELALTQLTVSKLVGKTIMSGIKTMLIHKSGEWISSESYLPTMKTKSNNIAQVQGSFGSYTRRYHIMSILCLATEDKDGVA